PLGHQLVQGLPPRVVLLLLEALERARGLGVQLTTRNRVARHARDHGLGIGVPFRARASGPGARGDGGEREEDEHSAREPASDHPGSVAGRPLEVNRAPRALCAPPPWARLAHDAGPACAPGGGGYRAALPRRPRPAASRHLVAPRLQRRRHPAPHGPPHPARRAVHDPLEPALNGTLDTYLLAPGLL